MIKLGKTKTEAVAWSINNSLGCTEVKLGHKVREEYRMKREGARNDIAAWSHIQDGSEVVD